MFSRARFYVALSLFALTTPLYAAEVVLVNGGSGTLTTGDNLDDITNVAATVSVVEIPGLTITASTGASDQTLNSLSTSFGVDTDGSDDSDRLEGSESFSFIFNQPVTITEIDFIGLDSAAEFVVNVGGTEITINEAALSNTSSDLFTPSGSNLPTFTNIAAGTALDFSINTGVVGLQGITLTVVPEPGSLALLVAATGYVFFGRRGRLTA
ncbi:MAG: PEP-CTERM sorting domain-containing protein [Planctomycetota bacterium]